MGYFLCLSSGRSLKEILRLSFLERGPIDDTAAELFADMSPAFRN